MGRKARPSPSSLPAKLRRIRRHLNVSQSTMLKMISPHVSQDYRAVISQFEIGMREPSLLEALAYARIAGISLDMLVDDNYDLPLNYAPDANGSAQLKEAVIQPAISQKTGENIKINNKENTSVKIKQTRKIRKSLVETDPKI